MKSLIFVVLSLLFSSSSFAYEKYIYQVEKIGEEKFICLDIKNLPWHEYFYILIEEIYSGKREVFVKFEPSLALNLNIHDLITNETPLQLEYAKLYFPEYNIN